MDTRILSFMNVIDLSIIIVNYNTKALLWDSIDSIIENTKGLEYEILVIDNGSTDGSQDMIRERYPHIILHDNKENVGFSKANNQGYRMSRGNYLLFLNSDTIIVNSAIKTMINYLMDHSEVGIVGPKIYNAEKQPSRSFMRFLDAKVLFLGTKYLSWCINTAKYRLHYDTYDYTTTQNVPWLSGACLMIPRNVFEEVGCFDEGYFLYLEDMDLCMQVKKKGYANIFLPSAEIIHLFGGSTKHQKTQVNKIYKDSARHYFRKNFSVIQYLLARLYYGVNAISHMGS
ncbi:MAG: hypothetical protein CSYNP_01138 [Syntrophus sp. SKADARSKE-3]|nr:hypothetical protein [Syntrophus sp. SKADARSKE-3]